MSCRVVNPAFMFWSALFSPEYAARPSFGNGSCIRCTWRSIKPGSTVARLRSMVSTPAGIWTRSAGPTSTMRSPLMTITWFIKFVPDFGSNKRPARTAKPCGGGTCIIMRDASKGPPMGRGVWAGRLVEKASKADAAVRVRALLR